MTHPDIRRYETAPPATPSPGSVDSRERVTVLWRFNRSRVVVMVKALRRLT